MTMPFPYGENITVITRSVSGTDPDGNDAFTDGVRTVYVGAYNPGGSGRRGSGTAGTEYTIMRDTVLSQPTAYLPAGTPITTIDNIEVRGRRFQVDGNPADWHNPFTGTNPGLEVRLKTGTG